MDWTVIPAVVTALTGVLVGIRVDRLRRTSCLHASGESREAGSFRLRQHPIRSRATGAEDRQE